MNNFLSNVLLEKAFYEHGKYFSILSHVLHIDKVTFEPLYLPKKKGSWELKSAKFGFLADVLSIIILCIFYCKFCLSFLLFQRARVVSLKAKVTYLST